MYKGDKMLILTDDVKRTLDQIAEENYRPILEKKSKIKRVYPIVDSEALQQKVYCIEIILKNQAVLTQYMTEARYEWEREQKR